MLSFNSVCPLQPLYIKRHVHNVVWLLMLVSLNAEVLVFVVAVGCVQGSISQVSAFSCGLCAGFLITGLCFQLTLTTSLWHIMPVRGIKNSRTWSIIQINYVLPKLCHLPQYSYGSRDPATRVLGFPSYPALWTWDPYSYWGKWHSMATHC